MDIDIRQFTFCGKLSCRSISTEEKEFSWDFSSCQNQFDAGKNKFKSSEFCSAEASWVLFTEFDPDFISFGILSQISSTSVEVFDCCCNISYRNLDNEILKSSEFKFQCGEDMPFIGMKDSFNLNSVDTQLKNVIHNSVIVCRFSTKRSTDTTFSSEKRAKKISNLSFFACSIPFLKINPIYRATLNSKFISTEEEELIWDVSNCANKSNGYLHSIACPDFSFTGATWHLVTKLNRSFAVFGIDVRDRCSSDEVFDCCCNISLQNSEGKIFEHFELKFKCDKAMPLVSMRDCYCSWKHTQGVLNPEEGILIICRISSKEQIIREACSSEDHRPEQKDDGSPVVNPFCKSCQDFRQLLQSGEYSDVILQVGDQSFQAHRAILAARSSVFASMFRHNMKEKATGMVNVDDCEASSFPVLLEFLYCGSTEKISEENSFGLYASSDKYDLQDLKMKCVEFIKKNISVETFCDTVKLSLLHSESELLKLAINFFSRNFKEIIVTVNWQNFIVENPIQSNEILIKAFASGSEDK